MPPESHNHPGTRDRTGWPTRKLDAERRRGDSGRLRHRAAVPQGAWPGRGHTSRRPAPWGTMEAPGDGGWSGRGRRAPGTAAATSHLHPTPACHDPPGRALDTSPERAPGRRAARDRGRGGGLLGPRLPRLAPQSVAMGLGYREKPRRLFSADLSNRNPGRESTQTEKQSHLTVSGQLL